MVLWYLTMNHISLMLLEYIRSAALELNQLELVHFQILQRPFYFTVIADAEFKCVLVHVCAILLGTVAIIVIHRLRFHQICIKLIVRNRWHQENCSLTDYNFGHHWLN